MKTVIEMAHETLERMKADEHCREQYWSATDDELQAFAELVRADERARMAEQPAQQEPVAVALNTGTKQGVKWLKNVEHGEHLYTSPPAQRTWVGLTDADKQEAFDETQEASGGFWEFADYLEAKLKEKNT